MAEEHVMEKSKPLSNQYNANVLKFRNLEWFQDDYPRSLALAWKRIVEEGKC